MATHARVRLVIERGPGRRVALAREPTIDIAHGLLAHWSVLEVINLGGTMHLDRLTVRVDITNNSLWRAALRVQLALMLPVHRRRSESAEHDSDHAPDDERHHR